MADLNFKDAASETGARYEPELALHVVDLRKTDKRWLAQFMLREDIAPFANEHDLRVRLHDPQKYLAFFLVDAKKPDSILATLQTGFTDGVPGKMQPLLTSERPADFQPNTAVFFSVVNHTIGIVAGAGGILIDKAVAYIREHRPEIRQLTTFSPTPELLKHFGKLPEEPLRGVALETNYEALRQTLAKATQNPDAFKQMVTSSAFAADVRRLTGHYLLSGSVSERTGKYRALCKVAQFHQGRGARLGGIHIGASPTPKALRESGGIAVNYFYSFDAAENEATARNYDQGKPGRTAEIAELIYGRNRAAGLQAVPD